MVNILLRIVLKLHLNCMVSICKDMWLNILHLYIYLLGYTDAKNSEEFFCLLSIFNFFSTFWRTNKNNATALSKLSISDCNCLKLLVLCIPLLSSFTFERFASTVRICDFISLSVDVSPQRQLQNVLHINVLTSQKKKKTAFSKPTISEYNRKKQ